MRINMLIMLSILSIPMVLSAQRHDRKDALIAESGSVRSPGGGTTVQIAGPYDKAFDDVVTYLKKSGDTLDGASRDSGMIATAMVITGGWHQTGRRTVVSVTKDTAESTSVRVAVTVQTRYKALQTEPWSDPKVDEKASSAAAQKLAAELPAATSHN